MSKYPLFPPPPSNSPLSTSSLNSVTSKRKWYQKKRWQVGGSAFGLLLFITALTDDPVEEPLPADNLAFVDSDQKTITSAETTIKSIEEISTTAEQTTTEPPTTQEPTTVTTQPSTVAPTQTPVAATAPPAQISYPNCDAVRAAGKAPIRAGDPGYGNHLDRDDDGIGCE